MEEASATRVRHLVRVASGTSCGLHRQRVRRRAHGASRVRDELLPPVIVCNNTHSYCLASRISVQRGEVMSRCCTPSHAHEQQWHALGMGVWPKQRTTLVARSALCEALVLRLLRFLAACHSASPLQLTQRHSLAKCTMSRRHFLGLKNQGACLFQEGQRLYEQMRFSEAAKSWGQTRNRQWPQSCRRLPASP